MSVSSLTPEQWRQIKANTAAAPPLTDEALAALARAERHAVERARAERSRSGASP